MVRGVCSLALPLFVSANSILHNPETHVPRASSGCGSSSPYSAGQTSTASGTYGGVKYQYRVYVPKSYNKNTPMPLVTQHHGWGVSASGEEKGSGITTYAEKYGYIAVYPQGSNDNTNSGGPWYSWNAAGTTLSPNPVATCTAAAGTNSYCYTSCESGGRCNDNPQCWWTTCNNEVTPTGTGYSDVTGFVPSLYNTLESQLCIDTTREFGAGESNGGMFTYQLGVDMASRLAAVVPEFGSFQLGHNEAPKTGVPILEFHGTKDTTVPANKSASGDGYFYTTVQDIYYGGKYNSKGWRSSNGCSGSPSHYPTSYDGQYSLYCVSEGSCTGGDVVRCSWNGGHNWYGNNPTSNGGLVSEFLMKWTKTSHVGYGCTEGESCADPEFLEDVTLLEDEVEEIVGADWETTLSSGSHFADPKDGCQDDEDVIDLGVGHICSYKVSTVGVEDVTGIPIANCSIGGAAPVENNGCPNDAKVSSTSKAFPICLAKGETDDPYTNGEFHCVLVCPCDYDEVGACGEKAHAHCPGTSTCQRGELRHRGQGVCTYSKATSLTV